MFTVPVKAPDNLHYEAREIISWIRTKPNGELASIYRICDFEVDDLEFDAEIFAKVALRVKLVIENDMKNLKDNKIIETIHTKYLNERKISYKSVIDDMYLKVGHSYRSGIISSQQRDIKEKYIEVLEKDIL